MKKRQKKEINFNPADYDYLDKAPLKKYIATILLRNEAFQEDCRRGANLSTEEDYKYQIEFYKKYRVYMPRLIDLEKLNVFMNFSVNAYRILPGENDRTLKIADELRSKSIKYHSDDDLKNCCWCNFTYSLNIDDNVDDVLEALLGLEDLDRTYILPDTLLVAIDLNSSKADIMSDIERILEIHKIGTNKKLRLDKWKDYIIAYDLRKQGLTFREISDELVKAYPDKASLFDEKNVENYYMKALALINGEYKKYI